MAAASSETIAALLNGAHFAWCAIVSSLFSVPGGLFCQVSPWFKTGVAPDHGFANTMAAAAAMNGSGSDTAARSQTMRAGISGTSHMTSRWIA